MAAIPTIRYTAEEYLDRERRAEYRSEYYLGEIFAMAGGSEQHALITLNIASELRSAFRGKPCRTYATDMRVMVSEHGLYTYPDVVALCEQPVFLDRHRDTLTNPAVIFEVLSPSTEAYDRGRKFAFYRRLESLREYALVSQDAMRIEHYVRAEDGRWVLTEHLQPEDIVVLECVRAELRLSDVYDKVEFAEAGGPL
jgi:Uma2 family endonuclease